MSQSKDDEVYECFNQLIERSRYVKSLKGKRSWRNRKYFIDALMNGTSSGLSLFNFLFSRKPTVGSVLLVSFSEIRRDDVNPIADTIAKSLRSHNLINLEDCYDKNTKRIYTALNIYLVYLIARIFLRLRFKIYNIIKIIDKINDNKTAAGSLERENFFNRIAISCYARIYGIFLDIIKPQTVLTINWYGFRGLGLLLACKNRKISMVDIQHGLAAAAQHRAYTNLQGFNSKCVPDYFWVWSTEDKKALDEQLGEGHAFVLGNLTAPNILGRRRQERKTILLVLGIGYPSWVAQLIEKLPDDWYLLIREHPSFRLKEREKERLRSNVVSFDDPSVSIYNSFASCDIVLGEWSAALVEASEKGIRAISVGAAGLSCFKNYKYIETINTVEDLCLEKHSQVNGVHTGPENNSILLEDAYNAIQ